ncbi:MAG: hypothetical protein EOO39_20625, partial [Cytophagaceae bacterium]
MFFSATVNEQVLEDCQNFMRVDEKLGAPSNPLDLYNPFLCLLSSEDSTLDGISQYYDKVSCDNDKQDLLCYIYKSCRVAQSIIFTNTIKSAEALQYFLFNSDLHLNSSIFHGSLSSAQRNTIKDDFISGSIRCLISTDVTARGFDAQGKWLFYNRNGVAVRNDQINYSKDPNLTDLVRIGNAIPKYYASFTANLAYKNWDFRMFVRGKFDYQILNTTALSYGN